MLTLRRAMDYITETQYRDGTGALTLTKLIHTSSALGGTRWQNYQSWRDALTTALRNRSPHRTAVQAGALAAAAMGCLDAATEAWMSADDRESFDYLLDEAFDTVDPG